MGIDLHIEELVLHGFASADRHRIAEAVQLELSRLMTAKGEANFLKNPLSLERIDGGAFKVQVGAKPQTTGTEIARAVYRGMRQQVRGSAKASRTQPVKGGRQQ
jgi:hypothetical protein